MRDHQGPRRSARFIEIFLLFALPFLLDLFVPIRILIHAPYTFIGVLVMLCGLTLANAARKLFNAAETSFQLQGESHTLVTDGPFRFSRNPIYLGMLLWVLGLAILLGSLSAFFLPVLLFLVMHFFMVPFEEKRMEEIAGEAYLEYKSHVRRWF